MGEAKSKREVYKKMVYDLCHFCGKELSVEYINSGNSLRIEDINCGIEKGYSLCKGCVELNKDRIYGIYYRGDKF